ncbi:MAG: hypothetical protein KKA42_11360, partial [candidate division Zixibacteria bacterium]|nr:hypothetical protein [candidate division Zixibacteria bacterium]
QWDVLLAIDNVNLDNQPWIRHREAADCSSGEKKNMVIWRNGEVINYNIVAIPYPQGVTGYR